MKRRAQSNRTTVAKKSTPPTVMTHVMELQSRLFSSVAAFLLVACLAYPYFDTIVTIIVAPLGEAHELVYLTPGGAFGFMIKVCMSIGVLGALPVIVFNIYRFLLPAVQTVRLRKALGYTMISVILALAGIVFAYKVSLPASLYFLTNFDLHNINPMLTIDSYFSFVMTYIIAGAILFQLPLIVLIIDSITPLKPSKMMKYQKHILLGSFIVAAIISPTPDMLNQSLLAAPVVVMYQVSIVMVALIHRRARAAERRLAKKHRNDSRPARAIATSAPTPAALHQTPLVAVSATPVTEPLPQTRVLSMDMKPRRRSAALPVASPVKRPPVAQTVFAAPSVARTQGSIDGMRVRSTRPLPTAARPSAPPLPVARALPVQPAPVREWSVKPRSLDGIISYS